MTENALKRSQIEQALIGRTITGIDWRNDPVQATATHSYDRGETDHAVAALLLDDGTHISFSASASLDSDEVWLSLEPPSD